ncbi:hypothetical protein CC86DRAFT_158052 [Ophiobolus disseminans]|uniref:Uncharacterized protein n=1 Tax=Ophiobolus disseminans TaxID=1469910 RepID=A0A6A6ZDR5_9PLEO|nr:hypothetical protein CC86DRAFT_158052 [Ophiobolus disseminans]
MTGFLASIINFSEDYMGYGNTLKSLITTAGQAFGHVSLVDMTVEQSSVFDWTPMVSAFWDEVQPRGHMLLNHEDPKVATLVNLVREFDFCLSLELQDADMTTPPSPLPAMNIQGTAATSIPEPAPPENPPKTSSMLCNVSASNSQIPPGPLFQPPSFTFQLPEDIQATMSNPPKLFTSVTADIPLVPYVADVQPHFNAPNATIQFGNTFSAVPNSTFTFGSSSLKCLFRKLLKSLLHNFRNQHKSKHACDPVLRRSILQMDRRLQKPQVRTVIRPQRGVKLLRYFSMARYDRRRALGAQERRLRVARSNQAIALLRKRASRSHRRRCRRKRYPRQKPPKQHRH